MILNEKEILEKLVLEKGSYSDILKALGQAVSGAAISVLKNKLDAYSITHHFIYEKKIPKRLPLEEILKEKSSYSATILKNRLIEEGLKKDECEECKTAYWNGKKLTLQLHHINGDHNDNRLENLQILCPNCHSLTDNYGSKKNREIKRCPDCNRPIGRYSTYCKTCGPKHTVQSNRKVALENRPSKEDLLEMLKISSFKAVGARFNVSDNTIRKWCKYYGIPSTKAKLKLFIVT